jgi:hypothetical protein
LISTIRPNGCQAGRTFSQRLESGENGAPGLTPGIRGSVVMLMVADGLYIRRLSLVLEQTLAGEYHGHVGFVTRLYYFVISL